MNLLRCQKCNKMFDERLIQESHDIPSYIFKEGKKESDKHGRHHLCEPCHKQYEQEILNMFLMNFIKQGDESIKIIAIYSAKLVRGYFFKQEGKGDG